MSYYLCARCNYNTMRKSDIKRHLERKVKCLRNINSFQLSDIEIYEKSIKPYTKKELDKAISESEGISNKNNNNSPKIPSENKDTQHISTENQNKNNQSPNLDTSKKEQCEYCQKLFSEKYNLRKHQKRSCKGIAMLSNEERVKLFGRQTPLSQEEIKKMIIEKQFNIANQTNTNHQNIFIINQPNLKGFDNEWNTEHLDDYIRQMILLSDHKYTNLLDELLKNKENLNVIMNKDNQYGLVYKNDDELYVCMKVREIIDKSIDKLYEQLNVFYKELQDENIIKVNDSIIEQEKQVMDTKFKDFCTNNNIKSSVGELLTKIYEKNNNEALNIAQKVLSYGKQMDKEIGF